MRILTLTLKKHWFDMIASGEKKAEYREIKQYWTTRFNKEYDAILFKNGYGANVPSMLIELVSITTGHGIEQWGAPADQQVYILKLGAVLKPPACTYGR